MERIDLDISNVHNVGLDDSFINWVSTVVDTINSDLDLIEVAVGAGLILTRADASPPANAEISDSFKDYVKRIVGAIEDLQRRVKALEGQ